MFNIKKFLNGIKIIPKTPSISNTQGELEVDSATGKLNYHDGATRSPAVTESHAAILTNKTYNAAGTGNVLSNVDTTHLAAGTLNINSLLTGASDTQVPSALAVKTYVDGAAAEAVPAKKSARAASTADIDLAVVADPSPVDGVTLADGDRILLKNQATASENGIYVAVTAVDPTTWTRAIDYNLVAEINGSYVAIQEGVQEATVFVQQGTVVTLGVTDIDFVGVQHANTALSNLTTTSINQDLVPSGLIRSIGSGALPWNQIRANTFNTQNGANVTTGSITGGGTTAINITGGNSTATGNLTLRTGTASTGDSGDIVLDPGLAALGTVGNIKLLAPVIEVLNTTEIGVSNNGNVAKLHIADIQFNRTDNGTQVANINYGSPAKTQNFFGATFYTDPSQTTSSYKNIGIGSGNRNDGSRSGDVFMASGDNIGAGHTGNLILQSGDSASGVSGNITLEVGQFSVTEGLIKFVNSDIGNAGDIWTSTDNFGSGTWIPNSAGGDLWGDPVDAIIKTADAAASTDLTMESGEGTSTTSGNINLQSGTGFTNSGTLNIRSGSAATSASGGVDIRTGTGVIGSGALQLITGNVTGTGASGTVSTTTGNKTSGAGGSGNSTMRTGVVVSATSGSSSGNIEIETGNKSGNDTGGTGLININSGDITTATNTSDSGTVTLKSGAAELGDSGNVVIATGPSAGGTRGSISLDDGTSASGYVWTATDAAGTGNWAAASGGGGAFDVNQTTHGFIVGDGIYHNGTTWVKGQADAATTLAYYCVTEFVDANNFVAADFGRETATAHGFTVGEFYFLSEVTPGLPTTTEPSIGFSNPLFFVEDANTLQLKVYRPNSIDGGIDLDQLNDTSVPTPADNEVLTYVSANNRWEGQPLPQNTSSMEYNETIAIGDLLRVINDSGSPKVKKVSGIELFETEKSSVIPNTVNYVSTGYDPISQTVIMTYQDGVTGRLAIVAGTISDSTLTFGTPQEITTGAGYVAEIMYDDIENIMLLAYVDPDVSNYGTMRTFSVSGTVITLNAKTVFHNTSSVTFDMTLCRAKFGKILVVYRTNAATLEGRFADVSGTTINFYGAASAMTYGYNVDSVYDPIEDRSIVTYVRNSDAYGCAVVVDNVAGIPSYGAQNVFHSASTGYTTCTYHPPSKKTVILYEITSGGGAKSVTCSITGTTLYLSPIHSYILAAGLGSDVWKSIYDVMADRIVYHFDGQRFIYSLKIDIVDGEVVATRTEAQGAIIASSSVQGYSLAYDSINGQTIIGYRDGSDSINGNATVCKITSPEDFFAVAQEAGIDTEVKKISLIGDNSTIHVGKIPGQIGYVQADGTLGESRTDYPIGRYISDTTLKITKNP